MALILDGSLGLTTPGVVNTAGETIATTLSVTGATNLAVSSGNVGIGTASPAARLQSTVNATNGSIGVAAILDAGTQNPSVSGGGIVMNFRTNSGVSYFGAVGGYTDGTNYVTGLWGGAAASGAPALIVNSSGNLLFNSGYGSAATAYGCRAWVNFNGTGTVAIRASGNVSSITDNGVGDYSVNFTTAIVDANYSFAGATNDYSLRENSASRTTSLLRVVNFYQTSLGGASAGNDASYVLVNVFR